jgi:hypothetical protein
MRAVLPPEHQLLLTAARVRLDAAARARAAELAAGDLDWQLLTRTAVRHGVAPLVFNSLSDAGAIGPGAAHAAPLWDHFATNAGNSQMLAGHLLDVLGLLEHRGIAAVAYKGPVLAASLYGNLALREFTDLDVLVRAKDVRRAGEALVGRGYEPELPLTAAEEHDLIRSRAGYFRRFDRPVKAGRVVLELHWRIPATFRLDQGFWRRLRPVRLLDGAALQFAPEDLALVLCAHGFKHGWSRLKWVCDVAELISTHASLDWDAAIDEASRAGGLRILLVGCALARDTLGVALPASVSERIAADLVARELSEAFCLRLFDDRSSHRVGVVCNLRVRERVRDRIRYGMALIDALTAPSWKDRKEWPVHRGARLVARVAHPFKVARRVAGKHRI